MHTNKHDARCMPADGLCIVLNMVSVHKRYKYSAINAATSHDTVYAQCLYVVSGKLKIFLQTTALHRNITLTTTISVLDLLDDGFQYCRWHVCTDLVIFNSLFNFLPCYTLTALSAFNFINRRLISLWYYTSASKTNHVTKCM